MERKLIAKVPDFTPLLAVEKQEKFSFGRGLGSRTVSDW